MWGQSRNVDGVNLIVDEDDSLLSFTATGFADPRPVVWQAIERSITPLEAVRPNIAPPPDCPQAMAVLSGLGLEVVADHGVWLGELNGLEVARVGLRGEECELDIGVGAYDQFASAALSVDRDDQAALSQVVEMVKPHRVAGAAPHPIGRLVRSRWLRNQLIADPSLIGLQTLQPTPLLIARPGLVESQPAAALGTDAEELKVLVVCSTGIDLGVAETAAGLTALLAPDRIMVVMPARDHHERIAKSLSALTCPAELVAIEGDWSD